MSESRKNSPPKDEDTLELVEQTMTKLAAQPKADIALLAKLDQLRAQLRGTLRRGGRR